MINISYQYHNTYMCCRSLSRTINMKTTINVTQFLRQYESENTRNSYRTGLRLFFESVYPEMKLDEEKKKKDLGLKKNQSLPADIQLSFLDIYSMRYLEEDRDHRDDIMNFKDSLKDKAPKTKKNRLNSVRVYLEENEIEFPKRFFKNLNGKVTNAISKEKIPTNDELRSIIEFLPTQGKALSLVLSSSGMRVGEAVQLTNRDIDINRDPVKINIRAEYTKTGKKRVTFISSEAKLAVQEWLNYRDQYVKQANARSYTHKRQDSEKIFPFTYQNFNRMWRIALEKAKLLEIDSRTNRASIRPHNLRKYFRLRVGRYGRDETECLMGHQTGLNAIYARFDDAEERLEEVYKKSIEDLSIYKRTVQVVQLDEEMKKTIRNLEDQVNALVHSGLAKDAKITYLTVNDEKKTKEIDQLNDKIMNMDRDIHNWKMTVQDFDKILTSVRLKIKKKTEEDEETKRRIANIELDIQSWNTLKPYLKKIFNYAGENWESLDITSKNRKVTAED